MKPLALVVTLIAVSVGCGGEGSPSAPTAIPGPPPPPATAMRSLYGYVTDTAFRAVGGARVEVLSDQHDGLVTMTDAGGLFAFDQAVPSPSAVRATKDGYAVGTGTSIVTSDNRAYVGLSLAALSPPAAIAGSYTLTIAAGSACADIPDEVRTRTYQATIVRALTRSAPAGTRFDGTVTGGQFAAYGNLFYVGVFGDYVSFSTEGEGPTIVEHLGGNRYVTFNGAAGASVGPEGVATIVAPFAGTIEYCELTSPIGQYYDCSAAKAAVRRECQSPGHQLTLARR